MASPREHRRCGDFIHVPEDGYQGQEPYFQIKNVVTDGMGQKHAHLWSRCRFCGIEFCVGMVHLPK